MSEIANFALRLPKSIKAAVEEVAKADGTSANQFIATAVAEKLAVMKTTEFFMQKKAAADMKEFKKILTRKGGVLLIDGD